MMWRLLGLSLLLGCATSRGPSSAPVDPADSASASEEQDMACLRQADVTVHVDNRSSMDVEISFGSYHAARPAHGFSKTTYRVHRSYLEGHIRLRIAGGGLELSTPPPIPTEPVACNDATLIIGPRPRYSFFYGDMLPERSPGDTGR